MKLLLTKTMMVFVAITTFAVLCTGSAQAQDANDPNVENLFDTSRVLTLNIVMDPCDWDTLRFACPGGQCIPDANGDHEYWQASLQCGTQGPMLIGIRRKNDMAEPSEADPQKISLKLDINRYIPGQLFAGKKKLSLECGSDMTIASQGVAWNIYQAAGFVTGRAAWVKVYVNGAYKGLYTNVEQIDKVFLGDPAVGIGDHDGFLFKMSEYEGEVQRTREAETSPFAFNWYPFDHPDDPNNPEVPTPADWRDQILWRVNMPHLLALGVAENFIGNTDGAVQKGTNYWYYDLSTDPGSHDPNFQVPRWYLPWDLDTVLKNTQTTREILHPGQAIERGNMWQGVIEELDEAGTPFAEPTFQADYLNTYNNLLDGPLALSTLLTMVNNIETVIAAEVDADPYTLLDITAAEEFQRIRDFLTDRTTYVSSQLYMLIPLPGTVLLDDGFEGTTWDANWSDVASAWMDETTRVYTGSHAAGADRGGGTGYFTSNDLDTNDANAIHISFYFQQDQAATLTLEYNGSGGWSAPIDLTALGGDHEWLFYRDTITDSNYFVPGFKIRFNAIFSGGGTRSVEVDDVIITKTTAVVQQTLTTSSTAGGLVTTPGEGAYQYTSGTDANIIATPDLNYHFVNWTGDTAMIADVNAATTTITMDADYTIQANFAIDQRTLTTSSGAGGSVTTPGIGAFPYDHGTDANIVATPDGSYYFDNWTGTGVTAGKVADANAASTTITMDANYTVQANFTLTTVPPAITSTAVTAGTVNQAYSYDVDATGIPAPTYALTVSPAGMTINATTGVIS
ncbi:MAG: InlB B-repeat-containing protein, partial [Planctomycetota bacterium]